MNVTIKIGTIQINFNAAAEQDDSPNIVARGPFSSVAEAMAAMAAEFGGAAPASDETTGADSQGDAATAPADTATTETEAVAETAKPELTVANLHAFLSSSDKYKKRSFAAIMKHFGTSEDDTSEVVNDAMNEDAVYNSTLRSGTEVYSAEAGWTAPVEESEVALDAAGEEPAEITTPELNITNLRAFLNSDARYAKRTKRSIQKHFGVATDDHAANTTLVVFLEAAKDDGDIETTQRRSDRVTLYSAA